MSAIVIEKIDFVLLILFLRIVKPQFLSCSLIVEFTSLRSHNISFFFLFIFCISLSLSLSLCMCLFLPLSHSLFLYLSMYLSLCLSTTIMSSFFNHLYFLCIDIQALHRDWCLGSTHRLTAAKTLDLGG